MWTISYSQSIPKQERGRGKGRVSCDKRRAWTKTQWQKNEHDRWQNVKGEWKIKMDDLKYRPDYGKLNTRERNLASILSLLGAPYRFWSREIISLSGILGRWLSVMCRKEKTWSQGTGQKNTGRKRLAVHLKERNDKGDYWEICQRSGMVHSTHKLREEL